MVRAAALFALAVSFASVAPVGRGLAFAQSASEPAKTVWSGVYTDEQAARGQDEYGAHCANCHQEDLSGYQGILKGERFMKDYREGSLFGLFDKIKNTMPRYSAGSLSDQAYVDIVTYILKANDFPAAPADVARTGSSASDGELTLEALEGILITGKSGPEPVPNFSLVQVVGCLTERESDGAWILTGAGEPVRTGHPQRTADDQLLEPAKAPGARTVSLMVSPAFDPRSHKGTEVEARGFLIRRPAEDRLNLTSLETIGQRCEQ